MAEVECITLDEDEEHDLLPGAGRIANHPQMVWTQLVLFLLYLHCLKVRCTMCVDPGLLPVETDMSKHRREVCHKVFNLCKFTLTDQAVLSSTPTFCRFTETSCSTVICVTKEKGVQGDLLATTMQ